MPRFQLWLFGNDIIGAKNSILCPLSLAFSIDSAKVMGINYLLLSQTSSMKVPKELIQNWFLLKMLCVDITLVHPLS